MTKAQQISSPICDSNYNCKNTAYKIEQLFSYIKSAYKHNKIRKRIFFGSIIIRERSSFVDVLVLSISSIEALHEVLQSSRNSVSGDNPSNKRLAYSVPAGVPFIPVSFREPTGR